jgi:hypothetical protein
MKKTTVREVNEREIGWLAGIIDGEGSITITKPKKPQGRHPQVMYGVHIVNNNKEMLEKCVKIVRFISQDDDVIKVSPKHYKSTVFKKEPHDCYQITIRRKETIRRLLREIIPLLTEKKIKSQKLLNFLENHKDRARLTEQDVTNYLSFTPAETK